MKTSLIFALAVFCLQIAFAQRLSPNNDSLKLLPNSVAINENNLMEYYIPINATTHIISPEPILYIDISTPNVEGDIQEKNIVRIRPVAGGAIENQSFTISVVTRTLIAVYRLICISPSKLLKESKILTYVIAIDPTKAVQVNQSNVLSQQQCYSISMQALSKSRRIYNLYAKAYNLSLWVNNIYIIGDYLLFDIGARNRSKLPFNIDQLRFKIKDKFKVNATVSQDLELQPMFQFYANEEAVITGSWRNFYIFKKFTYPTQKIFSLELTEQQISGRKIELKIEYNQVLKSQFLL